MEKFGIFELLDTLSALILPEPSAPDAPKTTPRASDAAFAPPAYGESAPDVPPSSATALSSFLEKHDKAVKKIDGGSTDGKPAQP